ncbi:hypothetical protein BOX15_Mlig021776g1, partial [Macrostomum lignano]
SAAKRRCCGHSCPDCEQEKMNPHALRAELLGYVSIGSVAKIEELLGSRQQQPALPAETLNAAFLLSCRLGRVKAAEALKDHVTPNARTPDGMTGLMLAARQDNSELLRLLLARDADAQLADMSGRNALHWATIEGKLNNVRLLLDHGVAMNEVDRCGCTALMYAVQLNRPNLVHLLVKSGADTHRPNRYRETPLGLACRFGYHNVVPRLLPYVRHPDLPDQFGQTPLMVACQHNHRAIVAQLLEHGQVDVNAQANPSSSANSATIPTAPAQPTVAGSVAADPASSTPLAHACRNRNIELARMLLERGAQPTEACLVLAALADSAELIDALAKNGAPVGACRQALEAACRMGRPAACRKLLELGAPVTPSEAAAPAGVNGGLQRCQSSLSVACQAAPSPDALACACALLALRPAEISPAEPLYESPAAPLSSNSNSNRCRPPALLLLAGQVDGAVEQLARLAADCRPDLPAALSGPELAAELASSDRWPLPMLVACYKLLMHGGPFLPKDDPELQGRCYADLVRAYLLRQPNRSADALLQDCPPRLAVAALRHPAVLEAALQERAQLLPSLLAVCCPLHLPLPGCQLDPLAFCLLTEDLESALLLLLAGASPAYLWRCHQLQQWPAAVVEARRAKDSVVERLDAVWSAPFSLRHLARTAARRVLTPPQPLRTESDWLRLKVPLSGDAKLRMSLLFDPIFADMFALLQAIAN